MTETPEQFLQGEDEIERGWQALIWIQELKDRALDATPEQREILVQSALRIREELRQGPLNENK